MPSPRLGRRRRLRRPPRIAYPTNAYRGYLRAMLRSLGAARGLVGQYVLADIGQHLEASGVRTDDFVDSLTRAFEAVRSAMARMREVEEITRAAARDVERHNREQVARQVETVIGIRPLMLGHEQWLSPTLRGWERENTALAAGVSEGYVGAVEAQVWRGLREGRTVRDLRTMERLEARKARNRAAFIAVDQVGSLNSQVTGRRHRDMGVQRYRWRNSRDERVRGRPDGKWPRSAHDHWSREGRIFHNNEPPADGHPGEPPRCRCWREPVFEDILGDEFSVDLTPAPIASAAIGLW